MKKCVVCGRQLPLQEFAPCSDRGGAPGERREECRRCAQQLGHLRSSISRGQRHYTRACRRLLEKVAGGKLP